MAEAPGMCELSSAISPRHHRGRRGAREFLRRSSPTTSGLASRRWRETIGGTGYLGSDNPLEGIEHLAGVTGGVRLPLNATGTASLLRVAKESSAYYVAEIEPETTKMSVEAARSACASARRGVTVRARPEITLT